MIFFCRELAEEVCGIEKQPVAEGGFYGYC